MAPLDRDAKPTLAVTLRLNEYQHGLLTMINKATGRPIQKIIIRALVPALEQEAAAIPE